MTASPADADRRLIEDYLPIELIGERAMAEKSTHRGHPFALHLWWARRALVACRATVYATLVDADQFIDGEPNNGRLDIAARQRAGTFVGRLSTYPAEAEVIAEAERHILVAHAARLSRDAEQTVTPDDIRAGRAPRPKVLDMFAGGGSIPLEALRLGCEAHAIESNPVAHIIELCTLVYPQVFGGSDRCARGAGPDGSWTGLVAEVQHWAKWIEDRARAEIGDLYAPLSGRETPNVNQVPLPIAGEDASPPEAGALTPIAYLWTRTVRCKNRTCRRTVPLVRQTWLCSKPNRYVALRLTTQPGSKSARFDVVESQTVNGLGFDPSAFSVGGNAVCPFGDCGIVNDARYIRAEGEAKRLGTQLMGIVCTRRGQKGKVYLAHDDTVTIGSALGDDVVSGRLAALLSGGRVEPPTELISPLRPSPNARGLTAVTRYGVSTFAELFTARQLLCLLTFCSLIGEAESHLRDAGYDEEHRRAILTYLAAILDRLADFNSTGCVWNYSRDGIKNTFNAGRLAMTWDFAETNPFNPGATSWVSGTRDVLAALKSANVGRRADVRRASATRLPFANASFDALITDPPYYDSVPYADLSDFFYVWLRRSIGHLYPEHFASELTPKLSEATALSSRTDGDMGRATSEYEDRLATCLEEAARVLKTDAPAIIVYAHKTTLGWSTLVGALRSSGFVVAEAWPIAVEKRGRVSAQDTAALASNVFIVARKRNNAATGSYESEVRPVLEQIVRERVETLMTMGIAGADLVIAAVGAGLRAYTRFARVEYANGEDVPPERFLAEVEGVVLETLLERIFDLPGSGVAAVDGPSRFYVLWRYAYRASDLDAGEAIVFTYGQPVELDGPTGLSSGTRALVRKEKAKYKLLDFADRGANERLGLSGPDGRPPSLIDVLHRLLWLLEHDPRAADAFLDEAHPDREWLRVLAQTLAGPALKGGDDSARRAVYTTPAEQSALARLIANWRSLVEPSAATDLGPLFAAAAKR